jgi:hypothetical protein
MNAFCTFAGHRWVRRAPPYTLHTSKILFIAIHKLASTFIYCIQVINVQFRISRNNQITIRGHPNRRTDIDWTREYWMIYRGTGFLAVGKFSSSPTPFPPLPSATCVLRVELTEERGGGGKEPNHTNSINHSVLSAFDQPAGHIL